MENNSKIGGILSIVSGAIAAFMGLAVAAFGVLFAVLPAFLTSSFKSNQFAPFPPQAFFIVFAIIYAAMGFFRILVGVFAIVGGYLAIKKKRFWWAIAGSIAAAYSFFPCGIAAVILIALGINEFQKPAEKEGTIQA